MFCCIFAVMAGLEDKQIDAEVATQKNKAHMILTEFSDIAYSGCEESLNKNGILPSQIKFIYETWYKKARVFNENKLFGLIFRDVHSIFLGDMEMCIIPSLLKLIVKNCESLIVRAGEPYLFALKTTVENQLVYDHFYKNNPHMVREHNRFVGQNALSLTTEAQRNNFTIDYFNNFHSSIELRTHRRFIYTLYSPKNYSYALVHSYVMLTVRKSYESFK